MNRSYVVLRASAFFFRPHFFPSAVMRGEERSRGVASSPAIVHKYLFKYETVETLGGHYLFIKLPIQISLHTMTTLWTHTMILQYVKHETILSKITSSSCPFAITFSLAQLLLHKHILIQGSVRSAIDSAILSALESLLNVGNHPYPMHTFSNQNPFIKRERTSVFHLPMQHPLLKSKSSI